MTFYDIWTAVLIVGMCRAIGHLVYTTWTRSIHENGTPLVYVFFDSCFCFLRPFCRPVSPL